jgi:hypothetical protein
MIDVDADVERLVVVLDELAALLADHSEPQWAAWIANDRDKILRGDGYGVIHVLTAFGGMGSLSDLVFDPLNGNVGVHENAGAVNDRFQALKDDVLVLASRLRRDAEDG